MRTYDNRTGFTVSYSELDANDFAENWHINPVRGSGWFEFDNDGNLVDASGTATDKDDAYYGQWTAFADACKAYGKAHIDALRKRHARQAVQA